MSDNSDSKIVPIVSKDSEDSSVVSLPGVLSEDIADVQGDDSGLELNQGEGDTGDASMDLTTFMDMMQNKNLGKAQAKESARKNKKRAKLAISLPARELPDIEDVEEVKEIEGAEGEAIPLHTGRSFKSSITLFAVIVVSLLLFGAVIHFADRQASLLGAPKVGPEGIVPVTATADKEILLKILSREE